VTDSIDALRAALAVSPDNLPLRRHLADVLRAAGRFAEAEAEYRTALRSAPDDAEAGYGLAETFLALGRASEAIVLLEDVVQREDAPAAAFLALAQAYLRSGDREPAAEAYDNARRRDPRIFDAELDAIAPVGVEDSPEGPIAVPSLLPEGSELRIERPTVTFGDVGGMESVKEDVRLKIIHPLANPELYRTYGRSVGGGILLYGPPGCGKTFLAAATAGEIQAAFLSVGLNDVLDMWLGQSEQRLHAVFAEARRIAPSVVFFDEVDALAAKRSDLRHHAGRGVVNQFLAELDGVRAGNEGVLVLAATNAPWHLDDAFLRPGRFDRVIFIPPPDRPARAAVLRLHLRDRPQEAIDVESLAAATEGFSGADLRAVVEMAIDARLSEAIRTGQEHPITQQDLLAAVSAARPSTVEWFQTARNYVAYANASGLYDDVAAYMKRR
jgi:transitional endoplasmic reticulum ATPase